MVSAEKRRLPTSGQTCTRITKENGVGKTYVKDAEQYAKGVDAAEEAVPGTKQKVLSGEVKPTAAEIVSIVSTAPEERPALVAQICRPKKKMKRTTPIQEKNAHSQSSSIDKLNRHQLLKIANSRYYAKQLSNGSAMLCEVSGPANTLIRRWESAFQDYPDILTEPENWAQVEKLMEKLQSYLTEVKDRRHSLSSQK